MAIFRAKYIDTIQTTSETNPATTGVMPLAPAVAAVYSGMTTLS
jgi:hypothetical protein